MPIEIRASDVMQGVADVLTSTRKSVGRIGDKLYEAEKVQQVNTNLAMLARAEQEYQDSKAQKQYDQFSTPTVEGEGGPLVGTSRQVDFGHASEADIQADHAKFVRAQAEYITQNVTNKGARDELLWHLGQQAVSSLGKAKQEWAVYRQHTAISDLGKVADATMANTSLSWEEKVGRVTTRVNAVVRAGDLWPEDGDAYLSKFTAQAQDAQAYAGALGAMKTSGTAKAGIDWLDANTPYYDADPAKREKLAETVQSKFNAFATEQDKANDAVIGDKYTKADTVEAIDSLASELEGTHYYDGNQKYLWDDRIRSRRDYLSNYASGLTASARDAFDQQLKDRQALAEGNIKYNMLKGNIAEATHILDAFRGQGTNPAWGEWVGKMADYIRSNEPDQYTISLSSLKDSMSKATPAQQLAAETQFRNWYHSRQQAPADAEIQTAITNAKSLAISNALEGFGGKPEDLPGFVAGGGATGTAGNQEAQALLTKNTTKLVELAKQRHPQLGITGPYVDANNEYGLGEGYPMMFAGPKLYAYQKTGNDIKLYQFNTAAQTRGGQVGLPGYTSRGVWTEVLDSTVYVNGTAYKKTDYAFTEGQWRKATSQGRYTVVVDKTVINAMNKLWRPAP